jgi:hypothetical protein
VYARSFGPVSFVTGPPSTIQIRDPHSSPASKASPSHPRRSSGASLELAGARASVNSEIATAVS